MTTVSTTQTKYTSAWSTVARSLGYKSSPSFYQKNKLVGARSCEVGGSSNDYLPNVTTGAGLPDIESSPTHMFALVDVVFESSSHGWTWEDQCACFCLYPSRSSRECPTLQPRLHSSSIGRMSYSSWTDRLVTSVV